VYRYREVKADGTDSFALESLLPGTGYDVHVSKLKVKDHGLVRTVSIKRQCCAGPLCRPPNRTHQQITFARKRASLLSKRGDF
jgi:hypothetical protein